MVSKLKLFYQVSKPGIVYANVMTAIAGWLFAAGWRHGWLTGFSLWLGLALLIVGACAANNVMDRNRDSHMRRTSKRALVTGQLHPVTVAVYAALTGAAGLALLFFSQNRLTAILAAIAYFDYVVAYGIAKRYTVHSTLIGCISGAIPLVAGYTAVTGRLNVVAWLLFALMVAWQMAHFYGLALYRVADYKAAGFPIMPVVHGSATTRWQALGYQVVFVVLAAVLLVTAPSRWPAGCLLLIAALWWFISAIRSFKRQEIEAWGRSVFLHSLTVLLVFCGGLTLGGLVS